jgi:hypothetical protein
MAAEARTAMKREGWLQAVRDAAERVATRARHVHVRHDRIAEYAAPLPLEEMRRPQLDPRFFYSGRSEDVAVFVVTLNTVNFGSGYWPHIRKRPGMSGFMTMASHLVDCFQAHGPFSAAELSSLAASDCAVLFGQEPGDGPCRELMSLYARALNDLGDLLSTQYEGSVVKMIRSAGGSAERLARSLTDMPLFRDVHEYDGLTVPIYKRAQITPADLSLALRDHELGRFGDLDELTIFADNLVPHVLRIDGVLEYDGGLARRIDEQQPVEAGSSEEIEIRAVAIHAVELIVAALRGLGREARAMDVDYLLWNRGQQPAYKARPRHRARSVYY